MGDDEWDAIAEIGCYVNSDREWFEEATASLRDGRHLLAERVKELEDAAREVLRWREGDLPALGYLRDNDKSREALAHLASVLGETPEGGTT